MVTHNFLAVQPSESVRTNGLVGNVPEPVRRGGCRCEPWVHAIFFSATVFLEPVFLEPVFLEPVFLEPMFLEPKLSL